MKKTVKENGPFDGVIGFSQGGSLTAMLCLMQESRIHDFGFKFAIIIAGFKSQCSPHDNIYSTISTIPSLHVIGEGDQVRFYLRLNFFCYL